ncbi:MAG: FKBP-type peptidyl-prolyl cis-trans isomerase FkpA, partial [Alteromonadaceae bacterium]
MGSIFKISLLAASMALVTGCGESQEVNTTETAKTAKTEKTEKASDSAVAIAGAPTTALDKQSYSLGVSFGEYLKRALDENEKVEIKLNRDIVMNGVSDALSGEKKLNEEEIKTVMQELD